MPDVPAPLLSAPPLAPAEPSLFNDLRAAGLHPCRAHEALVRLPVCADCLGRKCPRPCKMDLRSAGVEPALATGNASLLADCAVKELIEDQGRITTLRVRTARQEHTLRAEMVVLAAGA